MRRGLIFCFLAVVLSVPLTVHLTPHSHTDAGWQKTFERYLHEDVYRILPSVVNALKDDSSRKFNWADMAFFARWYSNQTVEMKQDVIRLVESDRLAFVGGGWVMNDEAVCDYPAIINQMTLGHKFIQREFGTQYVPTIAWQIDPFGGSYAHTTLWSMMGMDTAIRMRGPEYLKQALFASPNLTMTFLGDPLPQYDYQPNFLIHWLCHGYDNPGGFSRWEEGRYTNPYSSAAFLMETSSHHALHYRDSDIIMPFGYDFAFTHADYQFSNMSIVLDLVKEYFPTYSLCKNCWGDNYGACLSGGQCHEVEYSAGQNYTCRYGVRCEGENAYQFENVSISYDTIPNFINVLVRQANKYPLFVDDFLPYYDEWGPGRPRYWSGYYSSHGSLKWLLRRLSSALRSAEILYFYATLTEHPALDSSSFLEIQEIRSIEGILQHHDAAPSTSPLTTIHDYVNMSLFGMEKAGNISSLAIQILLSQNGSISHNFSTSPYPLHISSSDTEDQSISLVITNSLSWAQSQVIYIGVDRADVCIYDSNDEEVITELHSSFAPLNPNDTFTKTKFELYFTCDVPALGINTYFLLSGKLCENSTRSAVIDYETVTTANSFFEIMNNKQRVQFQNGTIKKIFNLSHRKAIHLNHSVSMYFNNLTSQEGVYTLDAQDPNSVRFVSPVRSYISEGTLVQKVFTGSQFVNTTVRLYQCMSKSGYKCVSDEALDMEYDSYLSGIYADIFVRYQSSLESDHTLYTDSNGFSIHKFQAVPTSLAGAMRPLTSRAYIQSIHTNETLGIVSDQAVGVFSTSNGSISLMIHRTTYADDGLGVGERLYDPDIVRVRHHLIYSHQDDETFSGACVDNYHRHSLIVNNPLKVFQEKIDQADWKKLFKSTYYPNNMSAPGDLVDNSLDQCLHILSLQKHEWNAEISTHVFRFLSLDTTKAVVNHTAQGVLPPALKFHYVQETTLNTIHPINSVNIRSWDANEYSFKLDAKIFPTPAKPQSRYHNIGAKIPDYIPLHGLEIRTFVLSAEIDPTYVEKKNVNLPILQVILIFLGVFVLLSIIYLIFVWSKRKDIVYKKVINLAEPVDLDGLSDHDDHEHDSDHAK